MLHTRGSDLFQCDVDLGSAEQLLLHGVADLDRERQIRPLDLRHADADTV